MNDAAPNTTTMAAHQPTSFALQKPNTLGKEKGWV